MRVHHHLLPGVIVPLLLTSFNTRAQTGVLTAAEMLPPGSEYTLRTLNPVTALDTTHGQGVVWQNSHLTFTGAEHTMAVLAPGATTWGANFPGSNYCLYESLLGRHSYFDLTPQSISRVGFHINGTVGTYTDPQVEFTFPLQFGTTHTDTWANDAVSFPGTYEFEVIGTGDLALPFGQYTDVLLLRVIATNIFPIQQYQWVSAQNGAHLLLYTMPGLFGPGSGQVTTSVSVGLTEHGAGPRLRVHAPVDGMLPITYTSAGAVAFAVRDMAGRLMATGRLSATSDARTEMVDVRMLGTGIHVLALTAPEGRAVERFFLHR